MTAGVVSRYYNDVIGGKDQVWQVSEAGFSEQSDTHREATGGMQRAAAALQHQQPAAAKRRSCCSGSGSQLPAAQGDASVSLYGCGWTATLALKG